MTRGQVLRRGALGALVVGLALQLVPLGAWHFSNPPVVEAAEFPTAEAEEIAVGACFDCHSHRTQYPPYAYVAPASWLLQRDITEGREEFNFSDFDAGEADDAVETILEGSMPPTRYSILHPDARLSQAETDVLVDALQQVAEDD